MALNPKTAVASRNLALHTEPSVPIRDLGNKKTERYELPQLV